jgi:hypothetical protein
MNPYPSCGSDAFVIVLSVCSSSFVVSIDVYLSAYQTEMTCALKCVYPRLNGANSCLKLTPNLLPCDF